MTDRRVTFLQRILKFLGLEGRLRLEWISSAEAQKFVEVVRDFTEKIRNMGPCPIKSLNSPLRALVPGDKSIFEEKINVVDSQLFPAEVQELSLALGDIHERESEGVASEGKN